MLSKLNNDQLAAIQSKLGPVIVVAGAGTGKTKVLTTRIAYLIKEMHIQPKKILAITFTNKAAKEMKERVNNLLEDNSCENIFTIHGLCKRILEQDIAFLNGFQYFHIIDEQDKYQLIGEIISQISNENGIDAKESKIKNNDVIHFISTVKTNQYDLKSITKIDQINSKFGINRFEKYNFFCAAYEHYVNIMNKNHQLDFDDLIIYTMELFEKEEAIKKKWQEVFDYILVDEFQDTDKNQFKIIRDIVNPKYNNIFVVGDEDQTIYTWRGAYPKIFEDFYNYFKNTQTYVLSTNYRSTKSILNISNGLIQNNNRKIEKKLITNNEVGKEVIWYQGEDEGKFVSYSIKKLIESKEYKYSDIAILYRANNQSREIEQRFIDYNIPYYIWGGLNFYQRKEIKDLLAYLKLINKFDDDLAIKRVINVPGRHIGPVTVNAITTYARKEHLSFSQALFLSLDLKQDLPWKVNDGIIEFLKTMKMLVDKTKQLGLAEKIEAIVTATNYREYIKDFDTENFEERNANINELINAVKNYETEFNDHDIGKFLNNISLYTTYDTKTDNKDCVQMLTVHNAKGMEYPVVFIIGINQGILPIVKLGGNIEEERRIMYVAITRAKQRLFLSTKTGYNFVKNEYYKPSVFLNEIKSEHLKSVNDAYMGITKDDGQYFDSKKVVNYQQNYLNEKRDFVVGETIVHETFGQGIIINLINEKFIEVIFPSPYGIQTLLANHKSIVRKKDISN